MARKTNKIDFTIDNNSCHICTSHKTNWAGYPIMKVDKKIVRIHRHIYEQCFGEIPKNMVVRHKCDNPSCINPEHLELGTHQDNMNDMKIRGRASKQGAVGSKNGMAKLNEEKVLELRRRFNNGESKKSLMNEFGIKKTAINDILAKRSWSQI